MLELCNSSEGVMNHRRQYTESGTGGEDREGNILKSKSSHNDAVNHHHHHSRSGRNSSEDPDIACTHPDKYPSSNTRHHPQAEVQSKTPSEATRHGSNHVYNHVTDKAKSCDSAGPPNGKRRRSLDKDDLEDVWTEHTSSSGRTYYYNKKLDKSQWSAPKAGSHGSRTEQGSVKKVRTDATPSRGGVARTDLPPSGGRTGGSKSSTPSMSSSKSLRHEGRRESGSGHTQRGDRSRASGHPRIDRGSGYKDKGIGRNPKEGGVARDLGKHGSQGDRSKHRDSHLRHSRSHSGSSSPIGGGDKHGGGHASKVGVTNHPRTSSGRSHTGRGPSSLDKATPSRTNRSSSSTKTNHTSPSHGPTPLGNPVQLISPTTPGSVPSNLTHTHLSQALTNTQQMIDQNSILIEQRQKLLAGGEATPTSCLTTPLCTPSTSVPSGHVSATPSSHQQPPLAKKRLSHNMLFQGGSPLPPSSGGQAFVHQVVGGVLYATMAHGTPQVTMDSTGLHPLQKALLIQNQQYSVVEPNLQATPTGLPSHMAPYRSHPASPVLQSPTSLPHGHGTTPSYSTPTGPIQPLTSLIYSVPLAAVHDFEATPTAPPQFCSKALQKPMSRLGYLNPSSDIFQFPDTSRLDQVERSKVDAELVDKMLASFWLQHDEVLSKQVDQCQLDTLRKRTVQNSYIRGQLVKRSLMLEGSQLKTSSRYTRFTQLQDILQELDKR